MAGERIPASRVLLGFAGLLLVPVLYIGGPYLAPVDGATWLREFNELKLHMARHYANLDWMVAHREVDLAALSSAMEERLASARFRFQAERALNEFTSAFHDPHLRVAQLTLEGSVEQVRAAVARDAGCGDLGYTNRRTHFRFPFEEADGWRDVSGAPFPSGLIGTIGVVRIAHFGEDGYRTVCEDVGAGASEGDTNFRVRGALQHRLASVLKALASLDARTVVVDLTGNGGGTDWAVEAARLFTDGPLTRTATPMVEPACDRGPIWEGRDVCGILGPTVDVVVGGLGAWTGPVVVFADGGTASASEDFIVRLRESGVARVIGERTAGAGCGYVDGGAPARLTAIGLQVLMPNCARFTRSGRNEVEGLEPDVAVAVTDGPAGARIAALIRAVGDGG